MTTAVICVNLATGNRETVKTIGCTRPASIAEQRIADKWAARFAQQDTTTDHCYIIEEEPAP